MKQKKPKKYNNSEHDFGLYKNPPTNIDKVYNLQLTSKFLKKQLNITAVKPYKKK